MFLYHYVISVIMSMQHIAFSIVGAIPFYFAWNMIAPTYFTFLPKVYLDLPYWHIVSAFIVFTFLGEQIAKITPKLFTVK